MELNESTYIVFEQHETYRNPTGRSIELRRIISRDIKDGETFAIVTNDKLLQYDVGNDPFSVKK